MINPHHTGEILAPFGFLAVAITLAQYNLIIGAITGSLACIYAAVKLYKEVKRKD